MSIATHIGLDRLSTLASFLDTLPDQAIDMDAWFGPDTSCIGTMPVADVLPVAVLESGIVTITPSPAYTLLECGFAACALGWACMIPSFCAAGLRLCDDIDVVDNTVTPTPTYGSDTGYDAASEFFGISRSTATRLFGIGAYGQRRPSPSDVSSRIREVVHTMQTAERLTP